MKEIQSGRKNSLTHPEQVCEMSLHYELYFIWPV
jgi:hypothetical protein